MRPQNHFEQQWQVPKYYRDVEYILITLPGGKQASGNNIRIRLDLSSCSKHPQLNWMWNCQKPVANLFRLQPSVEELPYYNTKV